MPVLDITKPIFIYNSYHLDPQWRKEEDVNRILLLEPSFFKRFPVGELVMKFILNISKNIPGIQIFCGEIDELVSEYPASQIISREHPSAVHYPGTKDSREWMFPEVQGYHPSFFSFWKKCEKFL
jgi:deoxyribodipyrimidine photo-lyase